MIFRKTVILCILERYMVKLKWKIFFHFNVIFSASKQLYLTNKSIDWTGVETGTVPWTEGSTEAQRLEKERLNAYM